MVHKKILALLAVFFIPFVIATVSHPASQINIQTASGQTQTLQELYNSNAFGSQWTTSGNNIYYNNGNVGIGTTAPNQKLHVSGGNVRFDGLVYIGGGSHTLNLWDENDNHGRLSYGNVTAWLGKDNVWFNLGGTGGQYFYIRDSNSNTKHWFNSNGEAYFSSKVGIGTTNPTIKLTINLDNVAGPVGRDFLRVEGGNSDNSRNIVINKPLFSVWSTSKDTFADFEASNITAHGNVGIGTTNPDQKLHVSGGNVRFDGLQGAAIQFEQQNGFHRIAFDELRFWDWGGGGDMVTFSNGNVGIGTTTPSATLDVNGDIRGNRLCIGSDCRNNWPSGGSGQSLNINNYGTGVQAQVYYDDNPSFYVDANSISNLHTLFTRSIVVGLDGLTSAGGIYTKSPLSIETRIGENLAKMELFVWENAQCNSQGTSLGCHGSNPTRCLCVKKTL